MCSGWLTLDRQPLLRKAAICGAIGVMTCLHEVALGGFAMFLISSGVASRYQYVSAMSCGRGKLRALTCACDSIRSSGRFPELSRQRCVATHGSWASGDPDDAQGDRLYSSANAT